MKIAIAIDTYKKATFERVLKEDGFIWETVPVEGHGVLILKVVTDDPIRLAQSVTRAQLESKQ